MKTENLLVSVVIAGLIYAFSAAVLACSFGYPDFLVMALLPVVYFVCRREIWLEAKSAPPPLPRLSPDEEELQAARRLRVYVPPGLADTKNRENKHD